MPQHIRCRYYTYDVPQNATRDIRAAVWICEQFRFPWRRQERNFTIMTDFPDQILKRGTAFDVDAPQTHDDTDAKFTMRSWTLRVNAQGTLQADAELRLIRPSPFERWFESTNSDVPFLIAMGSVALPLLSLLFLFAAGYNFPEPKFFWGWLGRHVQGIVGWSLAGLMLMILIWAIRRFRGRPYLQQTASMYLSMMILLVPLIWSLVSEPTEPVLDDEAGVRYLKYLGDRISTLPLLAAGTIPWLLIVLKFFQYDNVAAALGSVKDQAAPAANQPGQKQA
jgi:hypothetical protein